jgi:hypothetical protein
MVMKLKSLILWEKSQTEGVLEEGVEEIIWTQEG